MVHLTPASTKLKICQTKNTTIFLFRNAPIAQSVEQWSYKPYVAGSSPAGSTELFLRETRAVELFT